MKIRPVGILPWKRHKVNFRGEGNAPGLICGSDGHTQEYTPVKTH